MTKTLKKNIWRVMLIMLLITLIQLPSLAAGGSASASVGKTNLNIGETTSLTVSATNGAIWYNITSSNSGVASVSSASDDIDTGENGSSSKSYTIKAVSAGTATITVTSYTGTAYDESKISLNKSFTINVSAPQTNNNNNNNNNQNNQGGNQQSSGTGNQGNTGSSKSGDANLKSITVGERTYSNPSTDFTVTVGENVTQIDIKAETSNSKAKVTGTGTKELRTGTNSVTLKVTAENGATKNYSIRIRKLAEVDNTPNVVDNTPKPTETTAPTEETEEPETVRRTFKTRVSYG